MHFFKPVSIYSIFLICGVFSSALLAEDTLPVSDQSSNKAADLDAMQPYLNYLNEISERRRVNTLFANPGTAQDGIVIAHVRTSTGQLSFLRRDLVRTGRLPLVVGRVYDSNLNQQSSDFGAGWKLSLTETLQEKNESLLYTDAGGRKHQLALPQATSSGGIQDFALQALTLEVISIERYGSGWILTSPDLWTRHFVPSIGNKSWHLASISDNHGNTITLQYENNLLKRVKHAHYWIEIHRNGDSKITGLVDDLGATVSYHYNQQGQLSSVVDRGGNTWGYRYKNQLIQIIDPLGHVALDAKWAQDHRNANNLTDSQTKVANIKLRALSYSFTYDKGKTNIEDARNTPTTFAYNKNGITTHITNALNNTSELILDELNRPIALKHNEQTTTTYAYDESGRLNHMQRYLGNQATLNYQYNWHDQVVDITQTNTDGSTHKLILKYDRSGHLIQKTENGQISLYYRNSRGDLIDWIEPTHQTKLVRNINGQIIEVQQSGQTPMNLSWTERGQVEQVNFGDLRKINYHYNDLGFRIQSDYAGADETTYQFDSTGNLLGMEQIRQSNKTGDMQTSTRRFEINDNHLLTTIKDSKTGNIHFKYDAMGNPLEAAGMNTENPQAENWKARFEYDPLNRLTQVTLNGEIVAQYNYTSKETGLRQQHDDRTGLTQRGSNTGSGIYASLLDIAWTRSPTNQGNNITFNDNTMSFVETGQWGIVTEDERIINSLQRRRLELSGNDKADLLAFNTPSNSNFLPSEYNAMNCCVVCPPFDPFCENTQCEEEPGFCLGHISSVIISGPGSVTQNQNAVFSANDIGTCSLPFFSWSTSDGGSGFGSSFL